MQRFLQIRLYGLSIKRRKLETRCGLYLQLEYICFEAFLASALSWLEGANEGIPWVEARVTGVELRQLADSCHFSVDKHDQLLADLACLGNHVARLVDIETESLHEHLDRSLLNIEENLVLVLEV